MSSQRRLLTIRKLAVTLIEHHEDDRLSRHLLTGKVSQYTYDKEVLCICQ